MKNVVITGSSKGLGFEMAKQFLDAGYNVTLSAHDPSHLSHAAEELNRYKAQIHTCLCDVGKEDDIQRLWDDARSKWGSIQIWINDAGIPQRTKNLWEIPTPELENIINTNLMGVVWGTRTAVREMLKQGYGQVYNMEGFGSNGMRRAGINWYGTTKHAISYFTSAMAEEMSGKPVLIGRLSPGMMVTDFIKGNEMDVESTKKIYNILGDKPDAPARFLVAKMINNTRNNAHFVWLTNAKVIYRFLLSIFKKRNLFDE